jgi:hypothetical protein
MRYQSMLTLICEMDWRLFAVAAVMHLVNIVHSAVNMQPLNDKLAALVGEGKEAKDEEVG